MSKHEEQIVPFTAGDGFRCNLIHVIGKNPPTKGPVMLVHGAGVRANLFRAPVETSFVDYLIEHGYDVWLENWRASIDFNQTTGPSIKRHFMTIPRRLRPSSHKPARTKSKL